MFHKGKNSILCLSCLWRQRFGSKCDASLMAMQCQPRQGKGQTGFDFLLSSTQNGSILKLIIPDLFLPTAKRVPKARSTNSQPYHCWRVSCHGMTSGWKHLLIGPTASSMTAIDSCALFSITTSNPTHGVQTGNHLMQREIKRPRPSKSFS